MRCKWSSVVCMAVIATVTAGCSSGGRSTALPKVDRKDWTAAGLAEVNKVAAAIRTAQPGQCADVKPNDFSQFPLSMKQFNSHVVPTGQVLCHVDDELVEISAFASRADRDGYVHDRSTGICRRAKEIADKYKKPVVLAGLRWAVGAGNIAVQPDSEGLARMLGTVTGGTYAAYPCTKGITIDWDQQSVAALDAIGRRLAARGQGCDRVQLVGRETLIRTRTLTDTQLPVALGTCTYAGSPIEIITYRRTTPDVTKFIVGRVTSSCAADPALGRIDGTGFTVLAGGTIAEQVPAATGGTLATTTCTGKPSP